MTVFHYIKKYRDEQPDNIALRDDENCLTYSQLYNVLKNNQLNIKEKGYRSGDIVVLKLDNQFRYVITLLSFASLGCRVLPLPKDIHKEEMNNVINSVNAKSVIQDDNDIIKIVPEEHSSNHQELENPKEDTVVLIHLTSGSTSEPKYCLRVIGNLTSEGISYKETFKIESSDMIFSVPPMSHSYSLGGGCFATFVSGASLLTIDRSNQRQILRKIDKYKPTIMLLVPTMARFIALTSSKVKFDLSSLRVVLVGAGKINSQVNNTFEEKYGIYLMSNYGSTETGGIISRIEQEPSRSIGKPMYGVEIKIIKDSQVQAVYGEEGELWVKCNSMLEGYLNSEGSIFDKEGFYSTGDIVIQDKEGYIYIVGRKKNFIKVGGRKVNPYDIEKVLGEMKGIKDCYVLSHHKASGEECIRAIVVAEENISKEDIIKHCKGELSPHKIPAMIEFWDRLPRNSLGKIKKKDLIKKTIKNSL